MKRIEMEVWEPTHNDPQRLQYVGQRTAQEVFAELRHRLESTGYLPDEYFEMDNHWRDGVEIPKDAGMFTTVDYGGSEGIYLDIYLKWHDKEQDKSITQSFVTGKTLGESGSDMDRMNLIASAVTKAFHSDGEHARYIRLGEAPEPSGAVMHLNADKQRLLIDSLVNRRLQMKLETQGVELLLRRVTGSVIEFVNEVGERPMRIGDYDKCVLAIQDGSPAVLFETYRNIPDKIGELLVQAAGRSGTVGKEMTSMLLVNAKDIPNDMYLAACKNAIATGDETRVVTLVHGAENCVKDLDVGLYGDVMGYAISEHKTNIARAIVGECTPEQLRASNPYLMAQVLRNHDFQMASTLARSGLDVTPCAHDVIYALTWHGNSRYFFKHLMENGMQVDSANYSAMGACMRTDNVEAAKILIDRGMDFEGYSQWAEGQLHEITEDTFQTVQEYWDYKQEHNMGPTMARL